MIKSEFDTFMKDVGRCLKNIKSYVKSQDEAKIINKVENTVGKVLQDAVAGAQRVEETIKKKGKEIMKNSKTKVAKVEEVVLVKKISVGGEKAQELRVDLTEAGILYLANLLSGVQELKEKVKAEMDKLEASKKTTKAKTTKAKSTKTSTKAKQPKATAKAKTQAKSVKKSVKSSKTTTTKTGKKASSSNAK
ncbi:TPA: hypothetical protein ACH6AG_001533 [Campylobacter jejuni]